MAGSETVMMAGEAITPGLEAKLRYHLGDPCRFIHAFLRTNLWARQQEIVRSVFSRPRTSVKSCHSSGKTHVAAAIALTFLALYREAIVMTSAPSWNQVERLLWGEMHKLIKQSIYPWPKPLMTELKLGPKRYAYGLSTKVEREDEGVKFQGIHADNVLIILDEAPGIEPKLQEAAEAALSSGNAHLLMIGNPTVASGPFHGSFTQSRGMWNPMTISAFDTPNLEGLSVDDLLVMDEDELDQNKIPYLITRRWVRDMYRKYGPDHYFYQSRVVGNFPRQSEDSLLSLDWLEREREYVEGKDRGILTGGLDVAGPGEADTVLVLRDGPNLKHRWAFPDPDPRGKVVAALRPFLQREMLGSINVDTVGIGWGMYCHLRDEGFSVNPINVGEPAEDTEKFANLKAELYWGLRERAQDRELGGLVDEQIAQLSTIRYEHTPKGQIKIESKEDMIKRGVPSPDEAEAIMLSFARGLDVWERL